MLIPGVDTSAAKGFHTGTHRVVAPDATLQRVTPYMPIMGITRIANVTGLDTIGIPVVMVCRPNSRSLAVSQGKGLDLVAAKVSGVMEAIESYHAETIALPLKLATYEELRYTHKVVNPVELPTIMGSLFHPNFRLLWVEGFDLLQREPVWVPYEMVHTDYTIPLPSGSGCFALSSNGLASGNHVTEAISHAICEVVERDSTSVWHYMSEEDRLETRLDLKSIDDDNCRQVLEHLERDEIAVGVWETTSDIGIPSFLCTIVDKTPSQFRLLYANSGMGCHPSRHIALLRALTEAVQGRLTYISGSRDDTTRKRYEHYRNSSTLYHHVDQIENANLVRTFINVPSWESETFWADVKWELDRLQSVGIGQVIVVNLTKPEFEIPVVRVIIPGLEGYNEIPGFIPGHRARAVSQGIK